MSKNYFIIQYLRKSKLGNEYLAGYLNMILKSLLNNSDKFHFQINIRGGCWSKTVNSAYGLVQKVFDGVSLSNTKILLDDHYPNYSQKPTFDAIYLFCANRRSRGTFPCYPGTNYPDHSKEILIKCNGDPVFYLVGSSNFSKNTYMTKDRNINQTDVAFIKVNNSTKTLVYSIIKHNNNLLLRNFAETLDIFNEPNESDEPNGFYSTFIKSNNIQIVTAPYIGSDDIISNEYEKNALNREGF